MRTQMWRPSPNISQTSHHFSVPTHVSTYATPHQPQQCRRATQRAPVAQRPRPTRRRPHPPCRAVPMITQTTSSGTLRPLLSFTRPFPVGAYPSRMRPTPRRNASMSAPRPAHAYAVAPMMEVTDRHFRAMARLISRHCVLYTEMVVDRTLIHNDNLRQYSLRIPSPQQPLVLQLGGSVPEELEQAARIAASYAYTEVNLNCGCPSPKVAGKGCFGASLMRTPHVVARATRRMKAALPPSVPVTVKCRIGVDDEDSYEGLCDFVRIVHVEGGVSHFLIHARKAILGGLSPAQNRSIPPLKYDYVYRLLRDFPHLTFSINGGLKTIADVKSQLELGVHGVMVGRAVMDKPWHALCDVDNEIYKQPCLDEHGNHMTRRSVLRNYVQYAEREMKETGCSVRALIKPLLNLFHGEPNGKKFRRVIDESLRDRSLSVGDIIERACAVLSSAVLDAPPPSVVAALKADEAPGLSESSLSCDKASDLASSIEYMNHSLGKSSPASPLVT